VCTDGAEPLFCLFVLVASGKQGAESAETGGETDALQAVEEIRGADSGGDANWGGAVYRPWRWDCG
jgi:hypothetical protein